MAFYDYKYGKKRIDEILVNELEIKESEIPKDESFTFKNGYYSWVTAIFVDIRDSSEIFSLEDKEKTSKIIRSFTSEVIEVLRTSEQLREIGIRGDCVYAVFNSLLQEDIYDLAQRTFYINTFMKMLNKLLDQSGYRQINVGIGISSARELVVKAGRKDTGINNKVWIGDAVTKASNLSSLGSKNGIKSVVFSQVTYNNMIDKLIEDNDEVAKTWFSQRYDKNYGTYYDCGCVVTEFNDWINNGMKE